MPRSVTDVAYIPAESVTHERQPAIGYAMALGAGTLFALNGVVSKVILESGLSSLRLTEVRCTGALIGLAADHPRHPAAGAAHEPPRVALPGRVRRLRGRARAAVLLPGDPPARDRRLAADPVPRAAVRRAVRVLRAEGARSRADLARARARPRRPHAGRRPLARRVARRARRAVRGCCSAVTFAGYMLLAERAVGKRDPISLLCFGFLFATIFWAIVQPWWSFPFDVPGRSVSLLGRLSEPAPPDLAADDLDDPARDDRPVLPDRRLDAPHHRDPRRDPGDGRAGRGQPRSHARGWARR